MIVVSGRIYVIAGTRDEFLARSRGAMEAARRAAGCRDFVVAADPIETDRVNVFEEWESESALHAFRGEGPGDDLSSLIARADVVERIVD